MLKYMYSPEIDNPAISDVLYVLRDSKMYINEKKMWLKAIDLLNSLGYYKASANDNEKVSLFEDNR